MCVTQVKVTPSRTPSSAGSAKQNKKTVGSQFGDSLNALMGTLNAYKTKLEAA